MQIAYRVTIRESQWTCQVIFRTIVYEFFMSSKMCILSNRRKSMPTNNIKATGFRDISVWEIKFYILLQQSMELTIAFQRKKNVLQIVLLTYRT